MKVTQIKNRDNIKATTTTRDGNTYHVKPVFEDQLLEKCGASFVEVEPGSTAYGYHYHESSEEIFYIIKGTGLVETAQGEIAVKEGDVLSFPTGKGGAHVIKNISDTEKLVYLDFGTKSDVEIAHLPKANKMMVISKTTFGIFDDPSVTQ